jgi:nucleotide-binding universal stress UspA family protein
MSAAAVAVAVDGSPSSRGALQRALELAREQGRPLRGVFVLDSGWADYIGNDWQSSRDSRQGFLDYVRGQLESQSEAARRQFEGIVGTSADARFSVICGDPLEALCELMEREAAAMLVISGDVFQVCGRPSVKRLAKELPRRINQPVVVVVADSAEAPLERGSRAARPAGRSDRLRS